MNILFVTLVRGGSKSIPLKNIVPVAGKPLVEYTIDEVLRSRHFTGNNYMVSTDHQKIAAVCRRDGVVVDAERPEELSQDTSTSGDAVKYCCETMERRNGCTYDVVVEVMATNPLKTAADIDGCVDMYLEGSYTSVVAVRRVYDEHPSRVKYIENGMMRNFYPEIPESRRQDLTPPAYIRAGSIYVCSRKLIAESLRYDNEQTGAFVLDESRVINIDEAEDLERAQVRLQANRQERENP